MVMYNLSTHSQNGETSQKDSSPDSSGRKITSGAHYQDILKRCRDPLCSTCCCYLDVDPFCEPATYENDGDHLQSVFSAIGQLSLAEKKLSSHVAHFMLTGSGSVRVLSNRYTEDLTIAVLKSTHGWTISLTRCDNG
jgi:hypothetical protein